MRPIRMVELGVDTLPALFAFGQMLEQQTAGDPAALVLLGGEPAKARDLLRLREIALCGMREAVALQWHDPLVALVRHRLVECDRQVSLAEQSEKRRGRAARWYAVP